MILAMVSNMLTRNPDYIDVQADSRKARERISAKEWADKYFKLAKVGSDTLSKTQWKLVSSTSKFAYFRSGNQSGKSYAAAYLISITATGRYPSDYAGWKPKLRKDGAYAVTIWVLSVTGQMVRDGMQTLLLGDVVGGQVGTGLVPRDSIISVQMSRGIAGQVDYAVIKRDDGLFCKIAFKTYEQGRAAVQAEPVHLIALDELLDDIAMFYELIARTTSTSGILRLTATEKLQASPVARFFSENTDCEIIQGSVDDAVHLTQDEKDAAKDQYKSEAERNIRYYGLPSQGGGSVFTIPISEIKEHMNPGEFPIYYKYLLACDFSHFGQGESSSQFACIFMALDPITQVIRIFDAFKMRGLVEQHVSRIVNGGGQGVPVAWPHDGTQGQADGTNIATLYKKAGLRMLHQHATFESGGYNFESGIELMNSLLATGRLKVASHLKAWFDEYSLYERDDQGQVIKRADDLMSATRIGCMMIRAARVLEEHRESINRGQPQYARGSSNNDDFDPFTGR